MVDQQHSVRGMSWKVLVVVMFVACKVFAIKYEILLVTESNDRDFLGAVEKAEETDKDVRITKHTLPLTMTQKDIDEVCNLRRPDLVLDYTKWKLPAESMKMYSAMLRIPTVTSTFGQKGDLMEWKHIDEEQEKILVQIQQPADLIPFMIRPIVIYQKYTNTAIIYDSSIIMLHKLKQLLLNLEVRHTIIHYTGNDLIGRLNNLQIFNFFVIGKLETIQTVFNEACAKKFFKGNFAWHGITLDGGKLQVTCGNAKYVLAQPVSTRNDKHQDVVFNDDIMKITNEYFYDITIAAMDAVKNVPRLNTTNSCDVTESEDFFAKNPVDLYKIIGDFLKTKKDSLLSEPFRINSMWNNYAFVKMQLKGVNVLNNEVVNEQNIAEWASDNTTSLQQINGLSNFSSQIIYRISVAMQEPFLFRDETSKYNYSGFCIDLIVEIAERVGFKFELYSPEIRSFRDDFNETMNEVRSKKADIGLGSIFATDDFYLDFSIPFYELVGMLIMMKVPESSKSFFKIIEVLDIGVWGVLLALFFFTSFILWIFDKFSPYSYQNNKEALKDSDETREFTLKECFWFCLTSVTTQGGGEAPRCLSGRIVSGIWWLFGFIIIASYTANLAAFLTVSHLESSIESLEHLSKQYKIKYGVINSSSALRYFETLSNAEKAAAKNWEDMAMTAEIRYRPAVVNNSRDTLFSADYPNQNMYSKMLKYMTDSKSITNTLEEAIGRVKGSTLSENYAYIGDASDIKFAVLTNCDLQSVGEEFNKQFFAIVLIKGSALKEKIDNALMDLLNERKLERMKNAWWRENAKVQDCGNRRYSADGITIQNVAGVFILIGGGVVISLIIMGLDKLWEKRMTNMKLQPKMEK